MSDKKPDKVKKRGYRIDGGTALSCDLRVRITGDMARALTKYAEKHHTTRAAAARSILQSVLTPDK